jgi:hypothetical protein
VEILRRVDEISELEAVIRMHRLLAAMATTEMRQSATRPFGHRDRCIEAADLLAHFSRYCTDFLPRCPAESPLR